VTGCCACVRMRRRADVNQTEAGDDVGSGLKGSNVNHNNLPNSDQQQEPGATADAAAPVSTV